MISSIFNLYILSDDLFGDLLGIYLVALFNWIV